MQQRISKAFTWYTVNINTILAGTCGLMLLVLALERAGIIFSYEGHTAGIDNNFDYAVVRSLGGYSIYPNPSDYPYAVNMYAPLFFIVCKWAAVLFHITAADTILVYRITRAVCLLADTGTGLLLYLMLRRLPGTTRATTVCAIASFFAIICFLGYTINRSDSFFLFFYSAAVYMLLFPRRLPRLLHALTLALLATLCIYSKQNGISLLVLVPVWLAIEKNYRLLFQFILLSAIFNIALFIYFEFVYTAQFFSAHIIHALNNRIDPRWFYIYVFKLMAGSWLTLPLALSFVLAIKSIPGQSVSLLKKLGYIFILQLLFSIVLSFKWGSSVGYFNESFLLGFILITAAYCAGTGNRLPDLLHTAVTYAYPAIALFFLHVALQLFFFFLNSRTEVKARFTEQVQAANYIKKEIGNQPRYVTDLSDADFNFFKTLLYKEAAPPNIDAVSCCTLPGKLFDYSGLLRGFTSGKIMFIISRNGYLPASVWGVNTDHYKKDTSFNTYTIFRYDSAAVLR